MTINPFAIWSRVSCPRCKLYEWKSYKYGEVCIRCGFSLGFGKHEDIGSSHECHHVWMIKPQLIEDINKRGDVYTCVYCFTECG